MSKAKLIELIKMDDADLNFWLEDVSTKDARELFRQALKEQDHDTRHGCAKLISKGHIVYIDEFLREIMVPYIKQSDAEYFCTNYQDKDLEGL